MESNILKPDWLTDEVIENLRNDIVNCPDPYTKEDIEKWGLDEAFDVERLNAYEAIDTLTHYGIPLKKEQISK